MDRFLWDKDWSDGHRSAVVRVVTPEERGVLLQIYRQVSLRLRWEIIKDGLILLGDPSNGEGLSFIPNPEFEMRWHDTDCHDKAKFEHTGVILTVPVPMLMKMRAMARYHGVPMFSTTVRNTVIYIA